MKKQLTFFIIVFLGWAGLAKAQLAIEADTLYTMEGPVITDGVVLVNEGRIESIGAASDVSVPSGYEQHQASVVMPGMIDAHSVVGLSGIYNQDSDQDQLETSDPMQPELRAIDAYNAREELVEFVMDKGITTLHTGHGPGALASGQTMIAKTAYRTLEDALVDSSTAVAFTLGATVGSNFDSPGTRSKGVAMVRQKFIEAREYREKRKTGEGSTNLVLEALADVLDGEMKAMITAHRANDIMTALRLKEEFGFELILDGASEAYLLIDEIKEAGIPVIIHPTMIRTYGDSENASMTTAATLHEENIPFAFQSGYEGYVPKTRIVLYEAALATAYGLPREAALSALTAGAADILGLSDQIGSLAEGKQADLVLFDGDPLEYTTKVTGVIIDGTVVKE